MKRKFLATLTTGFFLLGMWGVATADDPVQIDATPEKYENLEWDTTYEFTIDRVAIAPPRQYANDSGYLFISETNGDFNNPPDEMVVVRIDGVNFGGHFFFKEDEWNSPIATTRMIAIPLDYTDLFYIQNAPGEKVSIEITPRRTIADNVVPGSLTSSLHSVWIGYNQQRTIADVIDFINDNNIDIENLEIYGNPGKGQLKKFRKILEEAYAENTAGHVDNACELLGDAMERADSLTPPKDLIVGDDVSWVFFILLEIRDFMGCPPYGAQTNQSSRGR